MSHWEIKTEQINDDYYWGEFGGFRVIVREEDGYMNGTKLVAQAGKLFKNWARNKQTREYIGVVESAAQIRAADLMETVSSSSAGTVVRGTYVHPDLVIHLAQWCSAEYAYKVTHIVQDYHTREHRQRAKAEKKARKKAEKKVEKREKKIDKLDLLLAEVREEAARHREENARYREEAEERERKAEERARRAEEERQEAERKAEERARQAEEERREAERKAERHARRTHAQLDSVQSDLGDVKEELVDVKGELGHVSRKLGVAKHQRVPPTRDSQSAHRLVVLRLGPRRQTKGGKKKKARYSHSIHRVQEKSLSASLASKRRDYPRAEVILDLETPNSMNLYNRFKEKYSRRIDWDGIYVLPIGTYDESKLIRDLKKLHEKRMTDASLE